MISDQDMKNSSEEDVIAKEYDQILKLANLNTTKQILMAIKLAYFPFAGRVMKNPDDIGLELLNEYGTIFKKIKQYLEEKE